MQVKHRNPYLEKLLEKFKTVQETNRDSPCGTANAVAAADPVPEAEEIILSINAKLLDLVSSGD